MRLLGGPLLGLLLLAAWGAGVARAAVSGVAVEFAGNPGKVYPGYTYTVRWEGGDAVPLRLDLVLANDTDTVAATINEDAFNNANATLKFVRWTVPAASLEGDAPYRVRVSYLSDAAETALSAEAFTVRLAELAFVTPHLDDLVTRGHHYTLEWTVTGDLAPAVFTLRENSSASVQGSFPLGVSEADATELVWRVPVSAQVSEDERALYIEAAYGDGTSRVVNSAAIQMIRPSAEITFPTPVEYLFAGRLQNITWVYSGDVSAVDVYVMNGERIEYTLGSRMNNTGFVPWDVPLGFVSGPEDDNSHHIRVQHADVERFQWNGPRFLSRSFVRVQRPALSEELRRGLRTTIVWESLEYVREVDIAVYDSDCAVKVADIASRVRIATATSNAGEHVWEVPRDLQMPGNSTLLTVRVTASDEAANVGCSAPAVLLEALDTEGLGEETPQVGGIDIWWFILLIILLIVMCVSCGTKWFIARRRKLMDDDEMVPELAHSASSLTAFSIG